MPTSNKTHGFSITKTKSYIRHKQICGKFTKFLDMKMCSKRSCYRVLSLAEFTDK